MIRHSIYLGKYQFICDLYNAFDDKNVLMEYSKQYVMFRKYEVINEIYYDTDIYIVEKSLVEYLIRNNFNKTKFLWPSRYYNNLKFSKNYKDFNEYLDFTYNGTDVLGSSDIYKFYEDETSNIEANIKCDKVRIYHPANIKELKSVIYIENYIGDVHFHYYCKSYTSHTPKSETTFKVNNNSYSEFIEFYIPNCSDLFSKYFYENLNIMKRQKFDKDGLEYYENVNYDVNEDVYSNKAISMRYLYEPYQINSNDIEKNLNVKLYTSSTNSILFNSKLVEFPINITLFPYSKILDNVYINSDINENSATFFNEYKFKLKSEINFSESTGVINIINKFVYPKKEKFSSVQDAYLYYNNVKLSEYLNYYSQDDEEMYHVTKNIPLIGFNISIYDNIMKRHLLFTVNINYLDGKNTVTTQGDKIIDDFEYPLTKIFDSWEAFPQKIFIQTAYVDKYLGRIYYSNYVSITKEKFKYFINNTNKYRINLMEKFNNGDIKFIDKINCVIVNENIDNVTNNVAIYKPNKIIYQPVFYKVQDLNTVKIKSAVKQNIGINLADYMTKVETFKLNIDNLTINEFARNDIFVLFEISASTLSVSSGEYYITNQDDEYISSGKWYLY